MFHSSSSSAPDCPQQREPQRASDGQSPRTHSSVCHLSRSLRMHKVPPRPRSHLSATHRSSVVFRRFPTISINHPAVFIPLAISHPERSTYPVSLSTMKRWLYFMSQGLG